MAVVTTCYRPGDAHVSDTLPKAEYRFREHRRCSGRRTVADGKLRRRRSPTIYWTRSSRASSVTCSTSRCGIERRLSPAIRLLGRGGRDARGSPSDAAPQRLQPRIAGGAFAWVPMSCGRPSAEPAAGASGRSRRGAAAYCASRHRDVPAGPRGPSRLRSGVRAARSAAGTERASCCATHNARGSPHPRGSRRAFGRVDVARRSTSAVSGRARSATIYLALLRAARSGAKWRVRGAFSASRSRISRRCCCRRNPCLREVMITGPRSPPDVVFGQARGYAGVDTARYGRSTRRDTSGRSPATARGSLPRGGWRRMPPSP